MMILDYFISKEETIISGFHTLSIIEFIGSLPFLDNSAIF